MGAKYASKPWEWSVSLDIFRTTLSCKSDVEKATFSVVSYLGEKSTSWNKGKDFAICGFGPYTPLKGSWAD